MSPAPRAAPVSRATTRPLRGSSTTRTPGIARATARRVVGAGVVDDEDFVWRSGLGEQGIEAGRQEAAFVIGADDRGDRQPHAVSIDQRPQDRGSEVTDAASGGDDVSAKFLSSGLAPRFASGASVNAGECRQIGCGTVNLVRHSGRQRPIRVVARLHTSSRRTVA